MNLKRSIYYRAKNFIEKEDLNQIIRTNKLTDCSEIPHETLTALETIKNHLKEATLLLDIGAHKGVFAKAANTFFNFEQTICFEPNSKLESHILRNTQSINCIIENLALSDKEGEIEFFLHEDDSMNSTLESDSKTLREEFPWDNPDLVQQTIIPTITLDSYIEKKGLSGKKCFLKLDTQGNELNILKHSTEVLRNTEMILTEYMFFTPYQRTFSFYDLIEFMKQHGFECKGPLSISKRPSHKVSAVDFLFVKS